MSQIYSLKAKLSKNQKLVKSIFDECIMRGVSNSISEKSFQSAKNMYEFHRKYRRYLRIKKFLPLNIITPFIGNKLAKMAYVATLI